MTVTAVESIFLVKDFHVKILLVRLNQGRRGRESGEKKMLNHSKFTDNDGNVKWFFHRILMKWVAFFAKLQFSYYHLELAGFKCHEIIHCKKFRLVQFEGSNMNLKNLNSLPAQKTSPIIEMRAGKNMQQKQSPSPDEWFVLNKFFLVKS